MGNIDKNYLRVQFWLKVHEKSATEFQTFFESIMQEAFPEFRKVRPYGKQGDKGNDGYRPDKGIYYQVYAPDNPTEKEAEAVRKLKRDFEKLKAGWDEISKIKAFFFVFNDKGRGVGIEIDRALSELKAANLEIEFKPFLAKELEAVFFDLKKESILSLGFDIDSTNTLRICRETLAKLEVYLDRGNGAFVLESIQNSKSIIAGQNDERLLADWEIMQCRALEQVERTPEARNKYQSLAKRYPDDPLPILHLAEIYLNAEDYDKAADLLNAAERIDSDHWLLRLDKLLSDLRLQKKIDLASIDEGSFPDNPRERSNFFRLYAIVLIEQKDFAKAESFVERAIHLNPDRLSNYICKLALLEHQLFFEVNDISAAKTASEKLLTEIDGIRNQIQQWGQLSARYQVTFNSAKYKAFRVQENFSELESLAKETFDLIMTCYFDLAIDYHLAELLMSVELPQEEFDKLLVFLRGIEKSISNYLAKALAYQFILKNTLLNEAKSFFEYMKKETILGLIANIEVKEYDRVCDFVKDDLNFAIAIANSAKDLPDLRKKIIEKLPDEGNMKEKLLLLLNYDEKKIDEAFDILRRLDFSTFSYFECRVILDIARQKKAWDFVIQISNKLLLQERNKQGILKLELELFDANLKLERLPEAIEIGEKMLSDGYKLALLDDRNKESLLAQTILARLTRGEFPQAMTLLETYPDIPKTFEFKLGVEAEVYLKNREAHKAITSIVDGIKILKTPTPEQYSKLFIFLGQIDNIAGFSLDSSKTFEIDSFIKFKGEERWYYVGDGDALDAMRISSADARYPNFSDKTVGDKVRFEFKYSSSTEHVIESILPIEKYIFTQAVRHFNQLAAEGNLEGVLMVAVPTKDDTIDITNIEAAMKDTRGGRSDFFDRYCQENIPLAILAVSEGGLTNAIGIIQNESRGFIRFSSGDPTELDRQKEVAKRILGGEAFYIDGTSALMFAETGLLGEIYSYLPNIKVSQSVITLLLKCKEKFRYIPEHAGYMQYVRGQLRFSAPNLDHGEIIHKNFDTSVNLLEAKPENIGAISAASKQDTFIEQEFPAEMCDACILAQKDEALVLTEDYLYLQVNEFTTGKRAPEYCSAFALVRLLYEQDKITFEKYLSFFAYLSGYRFRFLPVTVDDIEKAVFGDGTIMIFNPERIKWFNFQLTLSTSYGVSFDSAFRVVAIFLIRVLTRDEVLPEMVERIFLEILSDFPTDKDKRSLGKLLLAVCAREIERIGKKIIIGTTTKNKLDRLSQLAEIYTAGNTLWTPPD